MAGLLDVYSDPSIRNALIASQRIPDMSNLLPTAKMGGMMLPSAGITEMLGLYPDPYGEGYLPSTLELLNQGDYADVGYQLLGGAGDALYAGAAVFPPLVAPATAAKTARVGRLAKQNILDTLDPDFIARLENIASGKYANEPYYKSNASDLGQLTPVKPYSEMTSKQTQEVNLIPQTELKAEDFADTNMIFTVGDKTSTGRRIEEVDGVPLVGGGLLTEGGAYYTRGASQQADKSVWASDERVIDALAKKVDSFAETGDPTKLVYVSMSPTSDEYSKNLTGIITSMLPNMSPTRKGAKELDKRIRKAYPEWSGFGSNGNLTIEAQIQLAENGELRKTFLRAMEGVKGQGLPDVQSARKALTEEGLLGLPQGSGGLAVSDVTGKARVLTPDMQTVPHSTYAKAIQGVGGGTIGKGKVPLQIIAPSFLSGRGQLGSPTKEDWRSFSMAQAFKTQRGTPEFVDNLGQYLYEAGRRGLLD